MADVFESSGAGAAGAAGVDWQKRCVSLEMQLLRFRLQAGKIRELLAEKMQELEQRVTEADQRAESAEKQIQVMEEKLKSANVQTDELDSSLYKKYQDLTSQIQEKDVIIKRLEMQLEKQILARAQEAKMIEEKAAKIKDWVTFKLREMEQENQHLKMTNLQQTEQILLLHDKLQCEYTVDRRVHSFCPDITFSLSVQYQYCRLVYWLIPESISVSHQYEYWQESYILLLLVTRLCLSAGLGTSRGPPGRAGGSDVKRTPEEVSKGICVGELSALEVGSPSRTREGPSSSSSPVFVSRAELSVCLKEQPESSDRDNSSDELNSKFRSQCLHSSSSSSSSSSANIRRITKSPLLPRSPSTNNPFPNPPHVPAHQSGTSMTLPKVRTPLTPRDSIQLVKKHYSQPQPSLDRLHHLNVNIDIMTPSSTSSTLKSTGTSTSPFSHELERLDPEYLKPPTPPLHRFPSWKATKISSVPLPEDDSGSEDDSSSLASLRTSILSPERKSSVPGSPRAVKRGVSMSSISSESDYAIPPDAYSLDSDYSEPEHKVQRTSSYSCESIGPEMLEKSGYLLKMGSQVKAWKRRWFILRNGEILYYKSPSDVIRKPQGQIELNSACCVVRGEGAQTFQLITEKKTFYLTADSPNILEEWIRVLQNILKVQASSLVAMETAAKPTVRGWLTKVKHGHSKLVWCSLVGKVFNYYRNQEDKLPLGQLQIREASVQEVDRSCDSDEDYEAGSRGFLSSHCTIVVQPREQSPTYLLIGTKQEKDTWLYHLGVAAGSSANLKVGTEYERLIGNLLDADGDPELALWKSEALSFCKEGLCSPLTTLPSEALQTEALKLFKSCQLFINVLVESPSVDYHTSLAQNALQVCLTHPELQNEMYCQLIKQTNHRTPHNYSLTQCWQMLSLCVAVFLPQQHFLWYLKQYLQHNADPRSEVGKYAVYCQRSLERTLQNGEREARPSRMEIVSILLRNPYHHSLPFSIPVHFMNNTYQVVGFDGSTTVEEFLSTLNQRIGMRKPQLTGFALFTDDPSGKDLQHSLQPSAKICDVISKWEQTLKEMHPGKNEGTRIVRLTYKSRLCFRSQVKGETERERLLLAYQVNDEVQQGHFPVNKELALEVAALMAQVEHGDLDRSSASSPTGSPQPKSQLILLQALERFYPKRYKLDCSSEQLRDLTERLATKWSVLRGCTASECVRIYLTVARKWPLFGAKLFNAKPVQPSPVDHSQVWLAVNEDGLCVLDYTMHTLLTYSYQSVITFGGCRDDFMVVTGQPKEPGCGKKNVEKLIFAMAKPKVGILRNVYRERPFHHISHRQSLATFYKGYLFIFYYSNHISCMIYSFEIFYTLHTLF
uniref:Pleckstrin homology domain-containing family H member 1 n=1 Tax=Gouania willdenowi TaxID=441366 RepID=A0A8C5EXS3_GOUWI